MNEKVNENTIKLVSISHITSKIAELINYFILRLNYVQPLINLVIRLYIAKIFWKSGLTKIVSWDKTLWLFANEYNVPLLPVNIAAFLSTSAELGCSVLITIGLASRFAALALIIMTGVIEFTYMHDVSNFIWALLLGVILAYGAGNFSLDYLVRKFYLRRM